ncbi:MAG TPA: lipopolysaccharide transport periplasmic protein LptA [Zeimonas sp.]
MRASNDLRSPSPTTNHRAPALSPKRRRAFALAAAVLVVAAAAATPAFAAKGDSEAPTQVESDRMQYDDLKQVNVFIGNVVLTKGTIRLTADRLVVRQDPEGYQYATANGDLARFRQKRDGPGNQWVEGHALQIDYDGKAETVRLQRQAMLRRTENGRVVDEVHGNEILYESGTEFFTVEGGSARTGTPENPGGRVRVVIQPRDDKSGTAPKPSAPVPLKPDDRLEVPKEGGSGR